MTVVKVSRNGPERRSGKNLLPERHTGEKLVGEIVLKPSVPKPCDLLFFCHRGRAWPIKKLLVLMVKRRLLAFREI